jgi:acyl-CoA thioester hydrolase
MKQHEFEAPPQAFVHGLTVNASDIDELGHANNVVWVRWVNEAALAHTEAAGVGPRECLSRRLAWVVRRHDIEYLAPALEGEQVEVLTWAETLKGVTSLRRTLFRCQGRVLARAETTWILIDLDTTRPKRIPQDFLQAFGFET